MAESVKRDPKTGRPISRSGVKPEQIGRIQVVRDAHLETSTSLFPAHTAERSSGLPGGIGSTLGDFRLGMEIAVQRDSDFLSYKPVRPLAFSGATEISRKRFRSITHQDELAEAHQESAEGEPAKAGETPAVPASAASPVLEILLGWMSADDAGESLHFPDSMLTGQLRDAPGGLVMLTVVSGEVPPEIRMGVSLVIMPIDDPEQKLFRAGTFLSRLKPSNDTHSCILVLQRDNEKEHLLLHNAAAIPVDGLAEEEDEVEEETPEQDFLEESEEQEADLEQDESLDSDDPDAGSVLSS